MIKNLLLVFLGGGLGSSLRYLISKYLNDSATIPQGTLVVNVLGSFILGLALGWLIKQNMLDHPLYFLLAVGFCGGFTTFSSFSFENFNLIKSGDYISFSVYFLGSIALGIISVFLGILLSRQF
ncbi:fluoride efflux transporter CrcB [Christiangramia portivictoriae]|uniref:fluoride efflux transporter CrcB n=1 Tax=Christiangramia portivictoriae TaxID=326069 RepID=UPI00041D5092